MQMISSQGGSSRSTVWARRPPAGLVLLAALTLSATPARGLTLTSSTLIACDDAAFDGQDLVVDGRGVPGSVVVTIDCAHSFKSLQVVNGGIVTHSAGSAAGLDLTIAGDLLVDLLSRIDVSGTGHAGGAGPGAGVSSASCCTAGGSHGGAGGAGRDTPAGDCYGHIADPAEAGSGGGRPQLFGDGGCGGGIVRIKVWGSLQIHGLIAAKGTEGSLSAGGGAGGSILLIADHWTGTGVIVADGGSGRGQNAGGGGGGRIAVHYNAHQFTGRLSSIGGAGTKAGTAGGAGTIYLKQNARPFGDLAVDNGGRAGASTDLQGPVHLENLVVRGGAAISHASGAAALHMVVGSHAAVESDGRIDVSGRGYGGGNGPGAGTSMLDTCCSGGGGHGGAGGAGREGGGGVAYGSDIAPLDHGSGGGNAEFFGTGGAGGGSVQLVVGGALHVDGQLRADGAEGDFTAGGGAGGSIHVLAGALTGSGVISADGADCRDGRGGGGGGGRIALYTACEPLFEDRQVHAEGGLGYSPGQQGSIYWSILPGLQPQTCSNRLHVDPRSTSGANNGSSWFDACRDLQTAVNLARTLPGSCTEIWVAAGTYRPWLRTDPFDPRTATFLLNGGVQLFGGFIGTETRREQRDPAANPTILSGELGAGDPEQLADNCYQVATCSGWTRPVVLDGFQIWGGHAERPGLGSGLSSRDSRLIIRDTHVVGNHSGPAGAALLQTCSAVTLDDLTIGPNLAGLGGVFARDTITLEGTLRVASGSILVESSTLSGPGDIQLEPGTTMHVSPLPDSLAASRACAAAESVEQSTGEWRQTRMQCSLHGSGRIEIGPGHHLSLAGSGRIELSGQESTDCSTLASPTGSIQVDGRLLLEDQAAVCHAFIDVAPPGPGRPAGQFAASGPTRISGNHIRLNADQYLDLDPDPHVASDERPIVLNNRFHVQVVHDASSMQGSLLELRSPDLNQVEGAGRSGAYHLPDGDGYGDPWAVAELEVMPAARLNLTNRQGFVFQKPPQAAPEALYVRRLRLHPGAVVNTALQRLYYQQLVDESGALLEHHRLPDETGRRFVDQPLLGFSLVNIAMDDDAEFAVRMQTRSRDLQDRQPSAPSPPREGIVARRTLPDGAGGYMEMSTQAPGGPAASSVAAKGSFGRAGEEDVVVTFEYEFVSSGIAGDAELIVSLSDLPQVGQRNLEIARIRPPSAGSPGAIGSARYAVFYHVLPYPLWANALSRFHRGTYVELELRGEGAVVRIDNFDPQVLCRHECASYDGVPGVTEADFLILLAEYGRALGTSDPKSCLDTRLNRDHYVEVGDLLNWDTLMEGGLNSCGTGGAASTADPPHAGPQSARRVPGDSLLISGKPGQPGQQHDQLFARTLDGAWSASDLAPAGGTGSRANGRLVRDSLDRIYQLHGTEGLVRLGDQQVIAAPSSGIAVGPHIVAVGVTPTFGGGFSGVPITDAVFDPADPHILFVVPVLVTATDKTHTFRAAARLILNPADPRGYAVDRIYGADPWQDPYANTTTPPESSSYNVQKLREVEIDRTGRWLFVSSAQGLNANEWLVVYDVWTGDETRIRLTDIHPSLKSPVALLASSTGDKVYLASSVRDASSRVFRLHAGGASVQYDGELPLPAVAHITSLTEDPARGELYISSVQAPEIPEDLSRSDPHYQLLFSDSSAIFTVPRLFVVRPADAWPTSQLQELDIEAVELALPLSALYVPRAARADFDGDGDVDHEDTNLFARCAGGPATPYAADCPLQADQQGRVAADLDEDGDVDQADFGIFQQCFGGAGRPVSAACRARGREE